MTLHHVLLLALALFCIGLYGVLFRRHLIGILIGAELMLNAASLNFMAFNYWVVEDPAVGQIVVLFIIGLAAAEAAVALSVVLSIFRKLESADVRHLDELRG